jgi:hypothetical protein
MDDGKLGVDAGCWMLERREPHDSAQVQAAAPCTPKEIPAESPHHDHAPQHAQFQQRANGTQTPTMPPSRRSQVPAPIGRSSLIAGQRCRVRACLYGRWVGAVITVS